jgi:hypothetical protein
VGVLAAVEYGHQQAKLQDLLVKAGDDIFVATYNLMERDDGSVWSWAAWVRGVDDALVPEADVLLLGDNDDPSLRCAVRWADAVRLSGQILQREPGYDPPLWRVSGWPPDPVLAELRKAATEFPPPR